MFNDAIQLSDDEYYKDSKKKLSEYIEDGYGYTDGLNFIRVTYAISQILKNCTIQKNNISRVGLSLGLLKDYIKKSIIKYPYIGSIIYKKYYENRKHDLIKKHDYNNSLDTIRYFLDNINLDQISPRIISTETGNKIDISGSIL